MPSKDELKVKKQDLEQIKKRLDQEMEQVENRQKYLTNNPPATKNPDDNYSRLLGEILTRKHELFLERRTTREKLYELEDKIRALEKAEMNEPASGPRPK
jgi:hypothetical protein